MITEAGLKYMGMALVEVYPVPRVRKRNGMWSVTWCGHNNMLWVRDFFSWREAINFAVPNYNK